MTLCATNMNKTSKIWVYTVMKNSQTFFSQSFQDFFLFPTTQGSNKERGVLL